MSIKKLTEKRNDLRNQASAVLDKAKNEGRALTKEEKDAFDGYINQVAEIDSTIDAAEALDKIENKTYCLSPVYKLENLYYNLQKLNDLHYKVFHYCLIGI